MRENIAATYMVYIIVVLAFSISSARVVERESGLLKRSASVPTSSFQYVLADYLTYIVYSLLFCLIYLIVMRLAHGVLAGSLLLYLVIMGLASCFFLGLVMFLSVLIRKDQVFQSVMGLVMFVYILMATFSSMAKPGESSDWMLGLADVRPDKLILDACRQVRLGTLTFADLAPNLILAAIGLGLVLVGAAIRSGRKEKI
jgi:ABC-type multidrug transport system permease subunit